MTGILLTRAQSENELAAKILSALDYAPYHASMLSYTDLPYDFGALGKHIIITSKHAALIASSQIKQDVECWVIGEESAAILQQNKNIEITGTARNLKHLTEAISLVPEDEAGDFFTSSTYLSGDIITGELPSYIKRDIIYKTSYLDTLPEEAIDAIKTGIIKYVMVFSKNSASQLIKLLKKYKLLPYFKDFIVIGISQEVAILFSDICQKILYSEHAAFAGMVELLEDDERSYE